EWLQQGGTALLKPTDAALTSPVVVRSVTLGPERRKSMDPMEGLRAAMASVDAYYKERGIFQGRFGFGQSPALVVIDMAYGWTDPAYAGGSARLDAAVAAIGQLLAAARGRRVPVIYTTSPFQEEPQIKSAADFS